MYMHSAFAGFARPGNGEGARAVSDSKKREAVLATALLALFVLFSLVPLSHAEAKSASRQSGALQTAQLQAEQASDDYFEPSQNEVFTQALGTVMIYDIDDLAEHSWDGSAISITAMSGDGSVSYKKLAGLNSRYSIKAERAGKVTLTCTETWNETEYDWDEEEGDYVDVVTPRSQTYTFAINVIELKNTSGKLVKCVPANPYKSYSKTFTFKISGLPADASVQMISDSNKKGYSYISKVTKGKVSIYVSGKGSHAIKISAFGKTINCKAVLSVASLKKSADTKNTGSLVTYPGKKSTLAVAVSGVKKPKVAWTSTNKKIATVSKKGKVTAKKKGRCYIKAKVNGATVKVLVEVTSKNAYRAVQNGFADMRTKLTYSQANRMSKSYRDCSSFVSRCYKDSSLGRNIFSIGSGADDWALTAAGQASWLNSQGKRISWKACAEKKLRPGDTVYYETDYNGKDASQWRYIDHAGMYVGNGLVLNTGGFGGKGTIGFQYYWPKDKSIKFIGRPCP